ncbi:MAG: tetratricopeptide repeat protein [Myxococcales bacterium]|nr:tetratricopeptide repeat protein [Myxococcales bacterium]MCB9580069.1 tetratricopeptide repeat protein [Polyangiaceae bacterium]
MFDHEPREVAPTCGALLGGEPAPAGVYPGAAYAQLRAGRKGLVRGDLDEAERGYCRAVAFDPRNLAANVELARVLVMRRDGRAAADAARAALRIAPEDRGALLALGDALAMNGDLSDAREPLMRGSGVDPNDEPARASLTKAQMQLAERAARRREYLTEERFYRRAFALSPTNANAAQGVAGALVKQDKFDAALVWARRAAKVDPSATRQVYVGDVLSRSGDKAGATAAYKKAVELDPSNPEARARAMTHGN